MAEKQERTFLFCQKILNNIGEVYRGRLRPFQLFAQQLHTEAVNGYILKEPALITQTSLYAIYSFTYSTVCSTAPLAHCPLNGIADRNSHMYPPNAPHDTP